MNEEKKSRLGRGLDALLGSKGEHDQELKDINLERIEPNPYQPRDNAAAEEELEELAESVRENGILQPVILTTSGEGYYLVAGERRWRAARKAGLERIPALVRDLDQDKMMELALIENIHRKDLNPLEEARAYKQLLEELDLTQAELSSRLGRSRSSISNSLRLLKLPLEVQEYVSRETLSAGQARTLAGIDSKDQQIKAAEKIMEEKMSVRETEKYVSRLKKSAEESGERKDKELLNIDRLSQKVKTETSEPGEQLDEDEIDVRHSDGGVEDKSRQVRRSSLEKQLSRMLPLEIKIKEDEESWQLHIKADSLDQLENLLQKFEE
ncbi:ParB/RepB/Spo0J family partition protein [Halarsenatibacter silvermanii]|uniref:Chromosome segregation DNA-binding protein n=1 Tax=Halarsenatibacter silvermanii TaxID=321763 RepID=A0A1G9Q6I4_9FIRM|nr:ParB/RepB/Spo0J family partition protein [Halarsenatibacter silvermanii]SDM06097.1 chromosome segregation DNA-binding protein [Halarsenatibacter silvermanii]